MQDQAGKRFEAALQGLHEGLSKKGTTKRYGKILERIGRLKEKHRRVAQHYTLRVEHDEANDKATAIHWESAAMPGVKIL